MRLWRLTPGDIHEQADEVVGALTDLANSDSVQHDAALALALGYVAGTVRLMESRISELEQQLYGTPRETPL